MSGLTSALQSNAGRAFWFDSSPIGPACLSADGPNSGGPRHLIRTPPIARVGQFLCCGSRHLMQTTKSSSGDRFTGRTSWPRVCTLVIGYLLALAGCSLFFSLQMIYLVLAGGLVMFFASRGIPQPPVTWRSTAVAVVGCLVIIGILSLFGEDQVRQWRPHPGGYIPAWFLCFHACRQLRLITFHQKLK